VARAGDVIENPAALIRMRFVRTVAQTSGEVVEVEASYEPGSVEPLVHFHPRQDEHFEILAGAMRVRVGDEERDLRAGETLDIPAGTTHAWWNGGEDEARVRWETRPALRTEEFFETVAGLAREGKVTAKGPSNPLLGAILMREFRNEFRLATPPAIVQDVLFPPLALIGRLLGIRP
jgi:quercetin dioxygenase-like cupin family protein